MLDSLVKLVDESKIFTMDFSKVLNSVEAITGTPTVTTDCGDLTISTITADTTKVYFRLAGGSSCERCLIKVIITTTGGNTLVGRGILIIEE